MNEHESEIEKTASDNDESLVCPSNTTKCIVVQSGIRAGLVQKFEGGDIEAD